MRFAMMAVAAPRLAFFFVAFFISTTLLLAQSPPELKTGANLPDPIVDISPAEAAANQNYNQYYRPQFHYTPIQGLIGDATGLNYYDGTYYLFYMSDKWERQKNRDKRWGYAISTDLLHWKEQPSILDPVLDHKPGSGSGIVDWDNLLGLATGKEKTLVEFYTDYKTGSSIIYSTDAGKAWTRYSHNPILPRVGAGDRDPTVFWYAPAKAWRMVRHWEPFDGRPGKTGFAFFGSTNLLDWTYLSKIGDFYECPDIFELPVDDNPSEKKWVLMDAGFNYRVGTFDGTQFIPETKKERADYGATQYVYAPQTWKNARNGVGPPIQIGFMRYPSPGKMPVRLTWYEQMTFPCDLSLRTFPDGVRLCREPINEIQKLYEGKKAWAAFTLKAGDNPLADLKGEQLDIQAEFDLAEASAINMGVRGQTLRYSAGDKQLNLGSIKAPLPLSGNRLRLRMLVDHSSIEVFANGGQVSISKVFFFDPAETHFSLTSEGANIKVVSLSVNSVRSIWGEDLSLPSPQNAKN